MKYLSADSIHVGDGQVLNQGVLALDSSGQIRAVLESRNDELIPEGELQLLDGILCPGFVNAHCHLELSHLIGRLPQGTGLPSFLTGVTSLRKTDPAEIHSSMVTADEAMYDNGINLVGDISNKVDSIRVKKKSKITYHTFVELIGFEESDAEERMTSAQSICADFTANDLRASVSPHATYSLSDKLRKMLSDLNSKTTLPISIHNQETESEDQLFLTKTGKLLDTFHNFGLSMNGIKRTDKSALRSVLSDLKTDGPLLLVHNSCTDAEDMKWAMQQRDDLHWCSCPSANLYIELRSPKISNWLETGARICLGTDSLASNHKLSMVKEMELTQSRSKSVTLKQLIMMSTGNGAKALGQEAKFGHLKVGTSPGVIHLSGEDLNKGLMTEHVKLKRLA